MEANNAERDPKTLLIRHLPEQMTREERIDFCKYYGANAAAAMSDRGKMKFCAFAYFTDQPTASQALHKLHQMTVYGRTLTVEYARKNASLRNRTVNEGIRNSDEPQELQIKQKGISEESAKCLKKAQVFLEGPISLSTLSEKLGLKYPLNPALRYSYPGPTQQIITNIANTLASVPQFYTQVLHLMNKMNLPAPFTPASFPAPPLPQEETELPPEPDEMEMSSEEESELESDEENKDQNRPKDVANAKRPARRRIARTKRPRIEQLLAASKAVPTLEPTPPAVNPAQVFEEPSVPLKRPEIRLSEGIAAALTKQPESTDVVPGIAGGFGTFEPTAPPIEKRESENDGSSDDDGEESAEFIKREELKNRISKEDMKRMSVYKRYNPGEPNTRLYIKNLPKQAEEKDLKYIYGRYVDWSSALDKDMFSIQLMKQGRMKGQAFIGLPSEYAAKKALRETNGYLLQGKPLVVVYARSAIPKPDDPTKKGKKT